MTTQLTSGHPPYVGVDLARRSCAASCRLPAREATGHQEPNGIRQRSYAAELAQR